jgi:hypothetical protein
MKNVVWVLTALILTGICYGEDGVKSTTTKEDLAKTPEPPLGHSPFTGDDALKPEDFENKIPPIGAPPPGCGTKVTAFNVYTDGQVRGALKYNGRPRAGVEVACLNNNDTTLGPCRAPTGITSFFKFEAEVTFEGDLKNGFYGQLVTRPSPNAENTNDVTFGDDTPKNDWIGKNWFLKPTEKKENFPTVEVDGQTVRWIDSPQGNAHGPIKLFVIVYAGACGKLTNLQIFKLAYQPTGKGKMTEITEADLKKEVKSFKFK